MDVKLKKLKHIACHEPNFQKRKKNKNKVKIFTFACFFFGIVVSGVVLLTPNLGSLS